VKGRLGRAVEERNEQELAKDGEPSFACYNLTFRAPFLQKPEAEERGSEDRGGACRCRFRADARFT